MYHPVVTVVAASLSIWAPFGDTREPKGYATLAACEQRLAEIETPIRRVVAFANTFTAVEIRSRECKRR